MNRRPPDIVLASGSPRRLALACEAGWKVRVVAPPEAVEAEAPPRRGTETLADYVRRLAWAKAQAVAATVPSGTILACDTLSEVDGIVLGKPADRADARRMLEALSGRVHRVVTGVCLWRWPTGEPALADAESVLEMSPLAPACLERYLDTNLWEGKAGGCGFQDVGLPLRLVSGSPSNVVGLPVELVHKMLAEG